MENNKTPGGKAFDDLTIEDILNEARNLREHQQEDGEVQPVEEWHGPPHAQAVPVDASDEVSRETGEDGEQAPQDASLLQTAELKGLLNDEANLLQTAELEGLLNEGEETPVVKEPQQAQPARREPDQPVRVEEPGRREAPVLQTAELDAILADPAKAARPTPEWEVEEEEAPLPVEPYKMGWRERRAEKKRQKQERRHQKRAEKGIEEEDDIYYGLQLKPLVEYKEAYEKTLLGEEEAAKPRTGAPAGATFSYLFDSSDEEMDEEIAQRFAKVHKERRQRVDEAMKQAGVQDGDDIFNVYDTATNTIELHPGGTAQPEDTMQVEEQETEGTSHVMRQEVVTETFEFQNVAELNRASRTVPIEAINAAETDTYEFKPVSSVNESMKPERTGNIDLPRQPEKVPTAPAAPAPSAVPAREIPLEAPVELPVPAQESPVPAEMPETAQASAQAEAPAETKEPTPPQLLQKTPQSYRPIGVTPVHVIELHNCADVILREAKTYPKASPLHTAATKTGNTTEFPARKLSRATGEIASVTASVPPLPGAEPNYRPQEVITEQEEAVRKTPAEGRKFSLVGEEEPDNDPQENMTELEPETEEEELDDYQTPADAPSVQHELGANLRELSLRLSVTGIMAALLFLVGILSSGSHVLPEPVRELFTVQIGLILNLVFFGVSTLFSGVTLLNGLKSIFKLHANSDTGVALASVAVLAQSIVYLILPEKVEQGLLHPYALLAAFALFLNTVGKLSMVKRIHHNFRFASSPDQKFAVEIFDDHNTALQLVKEANVTEAPCVAYQHKAGFLKNFLSHSYEDDPSDQSAQTIAPLGLILSLVLCIVAYFLSHSAMDALAAFTAGLCMSVPVADMLCVNLPLARLTKVATRCGAMLVGYAGLEQFSNVNAVVVDAKDLFPKGTVILNGIKTFGGQRIDDAIMDATALMYATGGPLSDLFDQIIKSKRELLPDIENISYEDGLGVTGWVDGRRVLVGNRGLMEAHQIEPPSRDYEEKYRIGEKQIVYFASGGELVAMFVVSYNSDRRRALELRRMEDNGISLIVRTCDPNITAKFLSGVFSVGEHSVAVLPERLGKVYQQMEKPQEKAPAYLATKGRPTAMMRMLSACVRERGNISMAVLLQNVAVILGFVLVALMTCFSGLKQLNVIALLLFQLFWTAAIVYAPKLRKG